MPKKPEDIKNIKNRISEVGDLTQLTEDIKAVFYKHFKKKAAIAISFSLEPDYQVAHWVTNVSRSCGIAMFDEAAIAMQAKMN